MRAVYCATRNLYPRLVTTVNSLLQNNPNIEVTLVLEDRKIPCLEHPRVEIVTIDKFLPYMNTKKSNFRTMFTYMSCTRLAFFKVLKDDIILYLDVDTVVDQNIESLFEIDMTDKGVAGVAESPYAVRHLDTNGYINAGVMLMNLKWWRDTGKGDEILKLINSDTHYLYPDQDVVNIVCKDNKVLLDASYNEFWTTQISNNPKIVHYAGQQNWWLKGSPRNEYYAKYKCVSLKYCS